MDMSQEIDVLATKPTNSSSTVEGETELSDLTCVMMGTLHLTHFKSI